MPPRIGADDDGIYGVTLFLKEGLETVPVLVRLALRPFRDSQARMAP
jgi:hypothetical protein